MWCIERIMQPTKPKVVLDNTWPVPEIFNEGHQSQRLCLPINMKSTSYIFKAFGHFLIPQLDGRLQSEKNLSRHWKPSRN